MTELSVERYSPAELHAMDMAQTVDALYEIAAELTALGRLARESRLYVVDCRKTSKRNRGDVEAECKVLDAQAQLENIRDRVRSLKDLRSILQTILRSS